MTAVNGEHYCGECNGGYRACAECGELWCPSRALREAGRGRPVILEVLRLAHSFFLAFLAASFALSISSPGMVYFT
jgi:hypothetical protein